MRGAHPASQDHSRGVGPGGQNGLAGDDALGREAVAASSIDEFTRRGVATSAEHGARRLSVLPPACAFITHDEIRMLSLCFAAQAGHDACALRLADALVGPDRSRLLFASIEQLTSILARCSIRLSSSASALLRAYH